MPRRGLFFKEGADMRPGDDTYVPGYLMTKTAQIVGAMRSAAFVVRKVDDDGSYALELFRYLPSEEGEDFSSRQMCDALRRYVIPCLADGHDAVIDVPGGEGVAGQRFVLVFLARDASDVRGVAAMEVECSSRLEAERRLARLQDMMVSPHD
jgi:hypothetical protein